MSDSRSLKIIAFHTYPSVISIYLEMLFEGEKNIEIKVFTASEFEQIEKEIRATDTSKKKLVFFLEAPAPTGYREFRKLSDPLAVKLHDEGFAVVRVYDEQSIRYEDPNSSRNWLCEINTVHTSPDSAVGDFMKTLSSKEAPTQ